MSSGETSEAILRMEGVGYRYPGAREDALAGIDLEIGEGDFVILTGLSGCGKSTLAMNICGFLDDGERKGRIFFRKVEIGEKNPVELAGKIAYVNQDPEAQIVTLSVEEEVAFGLENFQVPRKEIVRRVREALCAVNGSHLWGRNTLELSGGEKQKVAIASMLALRPSILILDEPTSNLDPSSTQDVLEAIKKMHDATGITVMVLEHHLSPFLPFASHLVVMEKGKIVGQGNPGNVLSQQGMLENLGVRLPGPVDLGVKRRTAQARVGHSVKRNVLSIRGLHVSRGKKRVLRGVNLDLLSGEIVALMGDNGCGKTTLFEAVLGFLKPL
ncbi:MAG: ABC transporter ATP-binding protein, partial [Candidatus Thermoplasmatota archaeon]|nr:ABC transporter ATP-binding protein [Candidatus Thermoplasmatota archaeon]